MTETVTGTVVTVLFHALVHHARTEGERAELVRMITEDPSFPVCTVYVSEWPGYFNDGGRPVFPNARVLVSSDPASGHGALNYVNPGTPGGSVVDSYNPDTSDEPPSLPLDPEGGIWFPASASLPLARVREAIEEYSRTGQRPTTVLWQEGYWY